MAWKPPGGLLCQNNPPPQQKNPPQAQTPIKNKKKFYLIKNKKKFYPIKNKKKIISAVVFSTEKSIFRKKSGGTPNPRVKKFGVTPKPNKFVRVGQRSRGSGRPWQVAPRPTSAARTLADANKFMGFRDYPKFFDSRIRGTPPFFNEKSTFRRPLAQTTTHTPIHNSFYF